MEAVPVGRAVDFPRNAQITVGDLIDGYATAYTGHDRSRISSLTFWRDRFGHMPLSALTAELVQDALDEFATKPCTRYVGKDSDGKPVCRQLPRTRSAGTINAQRAALSSVVQWAKRRRVAPKGYVNPVREVPTERLNNARTRFLDERLGEASSWRYPRGQAGLGRGGPAPRVPALG